MAERERGIETTSFQLREVGTFLMYRINKGFKFKTAIAVRLLLSLYSQFYVRLCM